jgi:hypothetical protein
VNLTTGGTATAGVDYVAGPSSITIAAGANSASYMRVINTDNIAEGPETIIEQAVLADYPNATATKTISVVDGVVSGVPQNPSVASLGEKPFAGAYGASRSASGNFATPTLEQVIWSSASTWAWLEAMFPAVTFFHYNDRLRPEEVNATNLNGFNFCKDGTDPETQRRLFEQKIKASKAKVIFRQTATGLVEFNAGATDASAWAASEMLSIDPQISAGKYVLQDEMWETGTNKGGAYGSGQAPRAFVPQGNAGVAAACALRGVPQAKTRQDMIDLAGTYSPDFNPLPTLIRGDTTVNPPTGDTTHQGPRGAYAMALRWISTMKAAGFTAKSYAGATPTANNFVTNPDMAGSNPLSGTGMTGEIADAVTVQVRSRVATTLTAAKVSKVPKTPDIFGSAPRVWQEFSITGMEGMADKTREAYQMFVGLTGSVTVGQYYVPVWLMEVDEYAAWSGYCAQVGPSATNAKSCVFEPIVAGGGATQVNDTATIPLPNSTPTLRVRGMPFKATSTNNVFNFMFGVGKGAGTAKLRVTGFKLVPMADEYKGISDPDLLMYDETDTVPIAITSQATRTVPEEPAGSYQLTTNKSIFRSRVVDKTGSEGDFAAMAGSISVTGQVSYGPVNFAAPADKDGNNVYEYTHQVRGFKPGSAWVPQDASVAYTDIPNGFFMAAGTKYPDGSAITAGDDILTFNSRGGSGLTPVGNYTPGNIVFSANAGRGIQITVNGGGGILLPQDGDTVCQAVEEVLATSATSAGITAALADSESNYIGLVGWSNRNVTIRRNVTGVTGTQMTFTAYRNPTTNDRLKHGIWQTSSGVYQYLVFLNDVPAELTAGSNDVTAQVTGSGPLAAARRSMIAPRSSTLSVAYARNFRNRVATADVKGTAKGIAPLVFTSTGTASLSASLAAPIDAPVTRKVYGSTSTDVLPTITGAKLNGADQDITAIPFNFSESDRLRAPSAPGGTAGDVWVITGTQGFAGAINDGLAFSLTVTLTA